MTFVRLRAIRDYWRRHPRTDWLKAAQLKYKAPAARTSGRTRRSPSPTQPGVLPGTDLIARFGLRPGFKYRE